MQEQKYTINVLKWPLDHWTGKYGLASHWGLEFVGENGTRLYCGIENEGQDGQKFEEALKFEEKCHLEVPAETIPRGTITANEAKIKEFAKEIAKGKVYKLADSNCQHFVNDMLSAWKKETLTTNYFSKVADWCCNSNNADNNGDNYTLIQMTPDTFPNFLDTRTPSAALWDKISHLTPLKRLLKQDNPDIMSINGIAISASCALHPSPKEHIYFLPDGGVVFRNRSYHLPAGLIHPFESAYVLDRILRDADLPAFLFSYDEMELGGGSRLNPPGGSVPGSASGCLPDEKTFFTVRAKVSPPEFIDTDCFRCCRIVDHSLKFILQRILLDIMTAIPPATTTAVAAAGRELALAAYLRILRVGITRKKSAYEFELGASTLTVDLHSPKGFAEGVSAEAESAVKAGMLTQSLTSQRLCEQLHKSPELQALQDKARELLSSPFMREVADSLEYKIVSVFFTLVEVGMAWRAMGVTPHPAQHPYLDSLPALLAQRSSPFRSIDAIEVFNRDITVSGADLTHQKVAGGVMFNKPSDDKDAVWMDTPWRARPPPPPSTSAAAASTVVVDSGSNDQIKKSEYICCICACVLPAGMCTIFEVVREKQASPPSPPSPPSPSTVVCYCDFCCYDNHDSRTASPPVVVVQVVPHMHKIDRLFTCLNIDYKSGSSYHLLPIACWFSRVVVHSGESLAADVYAIIRHRMTKECGITISPIADNNVTDSSTSTSSCTSSATTVHRCKLSLDLPHLVGGAMGSVSEFQMKNCVLHKADGDDFPLKAEHEASLTLLSSMSDDLFFADVEQVVGEQKAILRGLKPVMRIGALKKAKADFVADCDMPTSSGKFSFGRK